MRLGHLGDGDGLAQRSSRFHVASLDDGDGHWKVGLFPISQICEDVYEPKKTNGVYMVNISHMMYGWIYIYISFNLHYKHDI